MNNNFGAFLFKQRHARGYSSHTFANLVGCSGSFISGIERGAQFPSKEMARKMLDALGIPYTEPTPFEIKVPGERPFKFTFTARGRGAKKNIEKNITNQTRDSDYLNLEKRVKILEDRLNLLERGSNVSFS